MVSVVRFSFFGKIHIMEHFLQNIYIIFANFVHYKKWKERYTIIYENSIKEYFFDIN